MNLGKFTINIAKGKPKVKRVSTTKHKLSKLINAKVILDDGVYKALISLNNEDNDLLSIPFTEDSYDLRGKEYIFSKEKDKTGHYLCLVRTKQHATFFPNSPEVYSPFKPGIIVKGYVVSINGLKYFDFKAIYAMSSVAQPLGLIIEDNEYI